MSLHAVPCFQVRCDWPGCSASPADVSEYSGWGEESVALDEARELDWWFSADGEHQFCNDHPAAWDHDLDQRRGMVGAYLLIDEDGAVSVVSRECEDLQ